jgi:hypothetical protein
MIVRVFFLKERASLPFYQLLDGKGCISERETALSMRRIEGRIS